MTYTLFPLRKLRKGNELVPKMMLQGVEVVC